MTPPSSVVAGTIVNSAWLAFNLLILKRNYRVLTQDDDSVHVFRVLGKVCTYAGWLCNIALPWLIFIGTSDDDATDTTTVTHATITAVFACLGVLTYLNFGLAELHTSVSSQHTSLQTNGMYTLSRNPMYAVFNCLSLAPWLSLSVSGPSPAASVLVVLAIVTSTLFFYDVVGGGGGSQVNVLSMWPLVLWTAAAAARALLDGNTNVFDGLAAAVAASLAPVLGDARMLAAVVLVPLGTVVGNHFIILQEEQWLRSQFRRDYRQYEATISRYV